MLLFDEARLVDRATNYWDCNRREAIEIKLQPNNFNRDSGLHISMAWDPEIRALRRLSAQHQFPSPSYARHRSQCTRRGKRPVWLGSSRQNQRSIGELLETIRNSTSYLRRTFFQLHAFFWRGPQSIKMAESLSFNNVTRQIAREDILNNQRRVIPLIYVRDLI